MNEPGGKGVMAAYTLYVDTSVVSQNLEKELERRDVQFVKVHHEYGGRILPTLTGPEGIYEGIANIELYFLARRLGHVQT